MSSAFILLSFFVVIVLMIVMVSKYKIHAVVSLLLCTILLGLLIGTPVQLIPKTINKGFGDTCASVALIIFLGSLLGEVLGETGAAVRITNTFIKVFGEKNVLWAVGASALLLGIPIFPDTISLFLIPICSNLAVKTGISMAAFAATVNVGVTSSSLVPPTPGPVAAAALLGISLGEVIPWGILVSIPGLIATVFFAKTRNAKIEPKAEFLGAQNMPDNLLPSFSKSVAPILVPVVLIVGNTVFSTIMPKTTIDNVFRFIGEPLAALIIGVFCAILLQVKDWRHKKEVRSTWIDKALLGGVGPIFITALGGSLAAFIKGAGVANIIAKAVVGANIPGVFVPMVIAILIRIITGSNTLALSTTAALVGPMLEPLGVTKLAAFLAMASGGIIFSHANSSGLWLTSGMANLDFNEALKSIGGSTFVSGTACCIMTLFLYFLGVI